MAQIAFALTFGGSQEVPPNDSEAFGTGLVVFDTIANTASYVWNITGIDFGPISGQPAATPATQDDATGFHFHNNVRGENGPIVFDIPTQDTDDLQIVNTGGNSWTISGSWEPSDPANTSINSFAEMLSAATVGSDVALYGNAHTSVFPGGEIRGQWVTSADDSANTVIGTSLGDILDGLGGRDLVKGKAGNDTLNGGNGRDTVKGGSGDDVLNGDAGADILRGGRGADKLTGGGGADKLIGGADADQFVFTASGNGTDTIVDFSGQTAFGGGAGQGDTFTFDDVLQGVFAYRGGQAFTATGNTEARVANGKVLIDADGNGTVDIRIVVNGLDSADQLVAADFQFI